MRHIIFSSLLLTGIGVQAQSLDDAKKAIDAEQFHKAKTILRSLVETAPDKGENYFYLADLYLIQKKEDSARFYLKQGLSAKTNAHLNHIGLGHLELNDNNIQKAQLDFNTATEKIRKRDTEELIQIGRAYLNSENSNPKKAIEYFSQARQADPKKAITLLYLGDAYLADKNTNEAFRAYRDAEALDKDLLRARLQMAVITKNAKAFAEAVSEFNKIVAQNPNYGPAYRELAETYNYWASEDIRKYKEYNQKALENYRKYMSLTDTSLESKMRYCDFLILSRDYATLQVEAQKMLSEQNVNPRIYRYLGYAAYENGNYTESIASMNIFFEKGKKFISKDYMILAKAKLDSVKKDGAITDMAQFEEALASLEQAANQGSDATEELSNLGEELYKERHYEAALKVFRLAIRDKNSKKFALDNLYFGNAVLFYVSTKQSENNKNGKEWTPEEKAEIDTLLNEADQAYAHVINFSPTTQDAHLNKAKVNRLNGSTEALAKAVESYENYIKVVTEKGEEELSKERTQKEMLAGFTFLGSQYSQTDKALAIKHFKEALKLNPTADLEKYITDSIKVLSK